MKLDELVRNTDALTYLNALKVTLTEIKEQFSEMEQQLGYQATACDKTKKLIRKADGQYRLLTRLVQKDAPLTSGISLNDALSELPDIKEVMEQNE